MSTVQAIIDKAVVELQSPNATWSEHAVALGINSEAKANDSWGYRFATPDSELEAFAAHASPGKISRPTSMSWQTICPEQLEQFLNQPGG